MSASPFDHPFLGGLFGGSYTGPLFTAQEDFAAMLRFEAALAEAEAAEGLIPREAANAIKRATVEYVPDAEKLRAGTARDGVVVPSLLDGLRDLLPADQRPHLHYGATSQDAIDTSLALRLKKTSDHLVYGINELVGRLAALETRDGTLEVMAHTRMQAAIPVPAARKIHSWRDPLERHRARLERLRPEIEILHLGGAAGTRDKLGSKGPAIAARMAKALDLNLVPHARHSERDGIAEFAALLSLVTGSLGKFGQDVALMAQTEMAEISLATGGGSSAMPHKKNPVQAEILVSLARFNATLLPGMHHALVHENERSGAAWTLEWMLLPQMVMATDAALRTGTELASSITFAARKR